MIDQDVRKSIAIVGCGWLGTALAAALSNQQVKNRPDVLVTTTSKEKQRELQNQGLNAITLSLPANSNALAQLDIFKQQQLIICLPPKIKHGQTDYATNIQTLLNAAQHSTIETIILISTTAVYQGLAGEITEQSALDMTNAQVQLLHQAEQAILNFNGRGYVLRLAGLVGPRRHPGRFLAGKTNLTNPEQAVNLIHQRDVIGIILTLLASTMPSGIFNGVSATRVNRKTFYRRASRVLALIPPEFIAADHSQVADNEAAKIISANKVSECLDYHFHYPDLMAWLDEDEKIAAKL